MVCLFGVGIVAGVAGEVVAFLEAGTFAHGFVVLEQVDAVGAGGLEDGDHVGEALAGAEIGFLSAGHKDAGIAALVAVHADLFGAGARDAGGVDDIGRLGGGGVLAAGAVAVFAADGGFVEGRREVAAAGKWDGARAAGVAGDAGSGEGDG
jgi:hypothetical protein